MKKKIRFSILVPVYNVEPYIDDCLKSVLDQSYNEYEVIVVDDGSTDESGNICDVYSQKDSRFKVFHKENQGPFHTRRYAIERASGDYYVFLDGDDLLIIDALKILAEKIYEHDCDCVFYSFSRMINNKITDSSLHIKEEYITDKRLIQKKALIDFPNSLCIKCARKTMFSHANHSEFYNIMHGEDLLQSLEILHNCQKAEFIDKSLYIYRVRENSITNAITPHNYSIDYTVREKVLQFIQEEGLFTSNDINEYRDLCIKMFINQLIQIGCFSLSNKEKKAICENIRKQKYYTDFLHYGITNIRRIGAISIIYYLFKYKCDMILNSVIWIQNNRRNK